MSARPGGHVSRVRACLYLLAALAVVGLVAYPYQSLGALTLLAGCWLLTFRAEARQVRDRARFGRSIERAREAA